MSGPGVFAVDIQRSIEAEAWRLSTVASTLVILFLYASYRSIVLVLLSLIPISSGILAGMVTVNGWFGFIHGITLGFGITLLGVVDDYPIHLFSRLTAQDSAYAVMKSIWPTVRLGVFSTAIGFSALLLAGFPALAQLGLFAVAGLLTASAVTRWVLPVFVPSGFASRTVGPEILKLVAFVSKGAVLAPIAAILATLTLMWSDTPLWQGDLARLTPVSDEKQLLDQQLRTELGAPTVRDFLVVEGATEEEALQRCEATMSRLDRAQKENALTGYDIVSRYLPSKRAQQQRRQSLPDREDLENSLGVASKGLPFAAGLFTPFLDAVDQARSQPFIHRASFQGTPVGMKIESLLFERGGRWMAVAPLRGVADRANLKTSVAGWNDPGVTYVDLKEESNQLMTAYRNRAITLLGWGTVAIALILAIVLKSTVLLWRVLLPTFCALLVVAAVLNLSGESLSLFHIATFLLVIGLGLDYALFFNRPEGTEAERARTIYGLLVCGTTTILVFGVLAFSTIPVLHAIGMTAASGSLCCLLFAGLVAEKEVHAT
jgi:predicted exporter